MQAESLVGNTLGQYQIVEELGRGGMAIVYKAWQPSLRRYVAIKVMLPHLLNDQEFMRRFQQEAIVAANLNHPNVVTIYEVEQQDDHLYIVMEYVEGKSLEEVVISEGPLHLERVTKILEQVADALDYAHRRQFVHRDIKPSNILVTPEGRAVISDFGIAKALRGSGATARLTATGTILGSPAYMSPEQIIGEDVDYRTDLYSLGIVAYEMLSGRAPFGGSTTALLYAQVNTTPPSIAALNPSLPPQVENALVRMLAKQPSQRFPNASAFVKALEGQSLPAQAPNGRTEVMPPSAATPYPQPQPQSQPQTVPYGGYGYGAEPQTQQAGSWPQAGQNAYPQADGSYYPASQPTAAPKKKRGSLLIWILAGGGLLAMIVLTIVALFLLEIGPFAGEEVV
ncbi:MAG: protein kinase domain-containing protein, partial [Anaerolineae bacterium]